MCAFACVSVLISEKVLRWCYKCKCLAVNSCSSVVLQVWQQAAASVHSSGTQEPMNIKQNRGMSLFQPTLLYVLVFRLHLSFCATEEFAVARHRLNDHHVLSLV